MKSVTAAQRLWNERRVIRFLVIGSFNTLLDIITLNILYGLVGLPVLLANTISVSFGITISYFLNHRIVFQHPESYSFRKYAHFFLVTGLSVLLVQNLVIYGVSKISPDGRHAAVHVLALSIPAKTLRLNIAKALAVIVAASWNFFLYKYVVFDHGSDEAIEDEVLIV